MHLRTFSRLRAGCIACVIVGLLLPQMVCAQTGTEAQSSGEPTGFQLASALEATLVQAIARSEKSVVAIARVRKSASAEAASPRQFGVPISVAAAQPGDPDFIPNEYATGVVVDKRGLILTANHVLAEDSEYWVTTSDRRHFRAQVKGADPRSDLAVLAIEAADLSPITFGNGSSLKKGQIVIALGNPYAIARDGQVSASWGIVANLSRKGPPNPKNESESGKDQLYHFGTLIQTDAKLNLGTSGGALLNLKGEMVGLTTALAALSGYEQSAGYALPVDDTFRRAVDQLKEGREVEYGLLGVVPENLMPHEVREGKVGARVREVFSGLPAHKAGIKSDDVITHVEGELITNSDELMLGVGRRAADAQVQVRLLRAGRPMTRSVQLTKFGVVGRKVITAPRESWRGLQVDYATALPVREFQALRLQNRLPPLGSVLITHVEPNSPAAKAELQPRMFITHVGQTAVGSPKEFFAAVSQATGDVTLRLALTDGEQPKRVIEAPAQ